MRILVVSALLPCTVVIVTAQAETPTREALIQHLNEGDLEQRRNAAAVLGDIGDGAVVPSLLDALKDEGSFGRSRSIACGRSGAAPATRRSTRSSRRGFTWSRAIGSTRRLTSSMKS